MSDPQFDIFVGLTGHIASAISDLMPDLRECEGVLGRFDAARLEQQSVVAPAVLVSLIDARQSAGFAGGVVTFDLSLAAFIVTKDQRGLPRDIGAANICTALAKLIPFENWSWESLGAGQGVRIQPLVTSAVRRSKLSLWAVTWSQPCTLNPIPVGDTLPLELYVRGLNESDEFEEVTP